MQNTSTTAAPDARPVRHPLVYVLATAVILTAAAFALRDFAKVAVPAEAGVRANPSASAPSAATATSPSRNLR